MPNFDASAANPIRYNKVSREQANMLDALKGSNSIIRLCPYCDKKISILYPGYHGPEIMKCHNCGEIVVFPAVKLSRSVNKADVQQ